MALLLGSMLSADLRINGTRACRTGRAEIKVYPQSGRFLMLKSEQAAGKVGMVVVVNWLEELRQRMGN